MTDKDDELHQTPCVHLGDDAERAKKQKQRAGRYAVKIEAQKRQLTMARYAMHKVRTKIYADMVVSGRLTEEQAEEEYRKAMENYDELMVIANEPGRIEPCVEDMALGFVMPDWPLFFCKNNEDG